MKPLSSDPVRVCGSNAIIYENDKFFETVFGITFCNSIFLFKMSILTVFIHFIFFLSVSEMSSAFRISKQRVLLPLLLSATPNRITEVTLNGLIVKKGRKNNSSYFSSCLDFPKALQMLNNDNYLLEAIEADRMPDESADQIMSYLTTCYESAQTFRMSDRICDREQFMIDIDEFIG